MNKIDCPQCKYKGADNDYYYTCKCPRCGYTSQQIYEYDEQGNALRDEYGNLSSKVEERKGFGCLAYSPTGAGATDGYRLSGLSSIEEVAESEKFLREYNVEGYLTSWDEETGKTKLVLVTAGCDLRRFFGKECPESMVGHIGDPCIFCGCERFDRYKGRKRK